MIDDSSTSPLTEPGQGNTGGVEHRSDAGAVDYRVVKAAGAAQAGALRAQASKGGLMFAAYLPPRLADWLLDHIERGEFPDPSEAVFVILGEHRELEPHADLREELLRRSGQAENDDPRPFDEVEAHLLKQIETRLPPPAVWRKTP
jgi:antitoxin ParD1/3/4